jgi:starch synthase
MVVLEAMAHELPVICLDFGGPGDMVTPDCGFAVMVGGANDTVTRLADVLTTLARDRSIRLRIGGAAKRHVAKNYLWRDRHEIIRQWYARVLPGSSTNIEAHAGVNACPDRNAASCGSENRAGG